jgi:hypothetical protein
MDTRATSHREAASKRIARGLNEVGWSALAFDFSGWGERDDDSFTLAKPVDDLSRSRRLHGAREIPGGNDTTYEGLNHPMTRN